MVEFDGQCAHSLAFTSYRYALYNHINLRYVRIQAERSLEINEDLEILCISLELSSGPLSEYVIILFCKICQTVINAV